MIMDLSIIVVHYNTPELLRACLRSIFSHSYDFKFEVIVVDNASCIFDGVVKDFPQVRVIRNIRNLGYARANNQGIKEAAGKYVLFLNPDTELRKNHLEAMVKYMKSNPDIGILGPKLLFPDGTIQLSCRKFYTLRAILSRRIPLYKLLFGSRQADEHTMSGWSHDSSLEVDWLIGACILIERRVLECLGGFDEGYKIYFEDVDLCYRVKKLGFKVVYSPDFEVIHHHRRESANPLSRKAIQHIFSAARFFRKYGWVI